MKKLSEKELRDYIDREGLNKIIDFESDSLFREGVYDAVSGNLDRPYPPVAQDLVQLHRYVRKQHFFTILEFGVGYSSLIFADALKKNQEDFNALDVEPEIRNRFKFQLFSVDSSEKWLEVAGKNIPDFLKDRVHFSYSPAEMVQFNGRICSMYQKIPDIIPDFIYVDGPDPRSVHGSIHGLSFNCWERTVMAGDLLLMESTMLPGTKIWFDGRVNNTRFFEQNTVRNFTKYWYPELDITIFDLDEPRLGKYNILGTDLFDEDPQKDCFVSK